jgi:hypothetical protein
MRRSPASTLEAARLNAECGTPKRRATRYKREPSILTLDEATLKLQGARPKREATCLKREGRLPKRDGRLLKRERPLPKREVRFLKRETGRLKRDGPLLKREGRTLKLEGRSLKRETECLKRRPPRAPLDPATPYGHRFARPLLPGERFVSRTRPRRRSRAAGVPLGVPTYIDEEGLHFGG